MIIGVSVGEGESGYVNEISEKFPAAELDADSQICARPRSSHSDWEHGDLCL